MEFESWTHHEPASFPPRRGQIKINIFRSFIKSAASIAGGKKQCHPAELAGWRSGSGNSFSSSSPPPTPPATPTGYFSDDDDNR
ncbi:unnamed protein product [Linum trigynum]|uniref:Uncharacterized protein n=1 Tax=Linum trigynum TaxID=586398 RepID=A0AAV2FH03_9ROSI